MKFVPTLPVRRKKDDVKQEPAAPTKSTTSERGGRGRGGAGRGRGAEGTRGGRGAAPSRPPPVEMTASGPFAMGPVRAGMSGYGSKPRAMATPIAPPGGDGASAALGANLTRSAAPVLKKEKDRAAKKRDVQVEDEEVYSDPDDGVEIVDMDNVRTMDWMAPESLKREKEGGKKKKLKLEEEARAEKGKAKLEPIDVDGVTPTPPVEDGADVNLANALDLSDSEDEEEMEDLIDDFAELAHDDENIAANHDRLYFFQFPEPFPTFVSKHPPPASDPPPDPAPTPDAKGKGKAPESQTKRVSFASDTKAPMDVDGDKDRPPAPIDGVIGQLEIHQSGAVQMRLANGIVMDVTAATQPSFLQQAVHVDKAAKKLHVLGEVSRRFVVTPDIDTLLTAMAAADAAVKFEDENLISMDTE
ncbi:hypothetical protein FA95DRAFT_1540308, partial [Auriscalpium vulgare]